MFKTRPDRAFLFALGLCGIGLLVIFEMLAAREYFRNDDWFFLARARSLDFSWLETFFPIGTERPFAIRPLGEVGFMRVGFSLFGFEAFGYYQISLLAHLARGAAVFAIARRLGVGTAIAAATAAMCLSRQPTLQLVWVVVGFASILASLFACLGVLCFLRAVQDQRPSAYVAALLCVAAGLFSHEVSASIPAIYFACSLALDGSLPWRGRIFVALRRVLPSVLLVSVYVAVRFLVVAPLDTVGQTHQMKLELHRMLRIAWRQCVYLTGGETALWLLLACMALTLTWLAYSSRGRALIRQQYAPIALIALVWIAATLAPIVLLPVGALRRSVPIEAPACLLIGGLIDVALLRIGTKRRPAALATLLVLVAASMPWLLLLKRLDQDAPRFTRHFVELVERERPRFRPGVRVVFLHGRPDLADSKDARLFDHVTYGGAVLVHATLAEIRARYWKQDLSGPIADAALTSNSIYILMRPGLEAFSIADDEYVLRHLVAPALRSRRPRVFHAAIFKTVQLSGAAAKPRLASACRERSKLGYQSAAECRAKVSALLRRHRPSR